MRVSLDELDDEALALRIAARRKSDGEFDYAMGFDIPDHNDSQVRSHGVNVIVAPTSTELLTGARLDYVELEPGQFEFIFLNPNDPQYVPPQED